MNTWTKQMGFPLIYVEAEQVSCLAIPHIITLFFQYSRSNSLRLDVFKIEFGSIQSLKK